MKNRLFHFFSEIYSTLEASRVKERKVTPPLIVYDFFLNDFRPCTYCTIFTLDKKPFKNPSFMTYAYQINQSMICGQLVEYANIGRI